MTALFSVPVAGDDDRWVIDGTREDGMVTVCRTSDEGPSLVLLAAEARALAHGILHAADYAEAGA